jgi:hypothetical protein
MQPDFVDKAIPLCRLNKAGFRFAMQRINKIDEPLH